MTRRALTCVAAPASTNLIVLVGGEGVALVLHRIHDLYGKPGLIQSLSSTLDPDSWAGRSTVDRKSSSIMPICMELSFARLLSSLTGISTWNQQT